MIKLKRRATPTAGLMLSPMIDMIFLLLVFFILSTLYMTEQHALPLQLPQAQQAASVTDTQLQVTVTAQQTYYLNKEELTQEQLLQRLQQRLVAEPKTSVLVRGEAEVSYQSIITLLDVLRQAGIAQVGLAVAPGSEAH